MDKIDTLVESVVTEKSYDKSYEKRIIDGLKKAGGETRVDDTAFFNFLESDDFWEALFALQKRGIIELEFPEEVPGASTIRLKAAS
jgi:hypothetical protein